MNNEEKILAMLEQLQRGQTTVQGDIRQLNQTVAKIEVEHGYKLNALYKAHVDTIRNASTLDTLNVKVEDHALRIWALEETMRTE